MKIAFLAVAAIIALTGCRGYPTEDIIEVKPNETAFLVPLEGASGQNQAKFESEAMLEKAQVAAKRVKIPKVWYKKGHLWFHGEWIPVSRVVVVDRSLVTRTWVAPKHINAESLEGIGFDLEVFCNALIKEEDAAKFLYFYGGKPLSDVVDSNVYADAADAITKKFGKLRVNECQELKGKIFEEVRTEVAAIYADRGITIATLGLNGGMQYDNDELQKKIDDEFISENKKIIAQNEQIEQEIRNQIAISKAEAETSAALALAAADEAFQKVRNLEIEKIRAEKWDGRYPQFYMGSVGDNGMPDMNLLMPTPTLPSLTTPPAAQ